MSSSSLLLVETAGQNPCSKCFVGGVSGEAGGERAPRLAAALRRPAEGRGRRRQKNRRAAGDLRGGLRGSECGGLQDGGDHKTAPGRWFSTTVVSVK